MEDWCVSGSGSEDDKPGEEAAGMCLEFGGIKIPPQRLLELMQTVHTRKTVELDSLGDVYHSKRHKKKKKRSTRLSGGKSLEDISETTSEIRSTTCTSTSATECRDMRKPKYDPLFDDPELDDNQSLSSSKPSRLARIKKAPPSSTHRKEKPLARLDKITADELRRKQRWQKSQQSTLHSSILPHTVDIPLSNTTCVSPLHTPPLPFQNDQGGLLLPVGGGGEGEMMEGEPREKGEERATRVAVNIAFDEEDSYEEGSESDSDMKFSLLSQINKVEKLLDFEVS